GGAAIGITPQNGSISPSSPLVPIFQSDIHRIRVAIPDGWIVDDRFNGTDVIAEQAVRQHGGEYVAAMCPQDQALPSIAGLYSCQFQSSTGTGRGLVIYSFENLQTRPEFSSLARENRSVTTEDLMGLYFDLNRGLEIAISPHVEIVTNTDTAVNFVDSQTNQTLARIPAKYVEFVQSYPGVSYREFVLLALNNDTNTGYALRPVIEEGLESTADAPAFVRQVFGSFELVAPLTTPPGATTTPPTLPTLSQPLQQDQQQLSP
ncbi:MAG: hypothetical protein ACREAS_10095, partial [Nitrososphaera sp.]